MMIVKVKEKTPVPTDKCKDDNLWHRYLTNFKQLIGLDSWA